MNKIKNFLKDESGLELSEYAVAAALIILVLVTAFTGLTGAVSAKLTEIANAISGAGK